MFRFERARQQRFGERLRRNFDLLVVKLGAYWQMVVVRYGGGRCRLMVHYLLQKTLKSGLSLVRHLELGLKKLSRVNTEAAKRLKRGLFKGN